MSKKKEQGSQGGATLAEVFVEEKAKRVYALALRDALALALGVAPKKGPFAYVHLVDGKVRAASPSAVVSVYVGTGWSLGGSIARQEASRICEWLRGHPEAWVNSWDDDGLSLSVPGQPVAVRSVRLTYGVERSWPRVPGVPSSPSSGSLYDGSFVAKAAKYNGCVAFEGLAGGYMRVTSGDASFMLAPLGESIYDGEQIEGLLAHGGEL